MLHSLLICIASLSSPDLLDTLYEEASGVYVARGGRETAVVSNGFALKNRSFTSPLITDKELTYSYGGFFCTPTMIFNQTCDFKSHIFRNDIDALDTMLNAHVLSVTPGIVQWYHLRKTDDGAFLTLSLTYVRITGSSTSASNRHTAERILVERLRALIAASESDVDESRLDFALAFIIHLPITTPSQRDEAAHVVQSIAFMRNPNPTTEPAQPGSYRNTYLQLMQYSPQGVVLHHDEYDVHVSFDSRDHSPIFKYEVGTPIYVGGMIGTFNFGSTAHLLNLESPRMLPSFIMNHLPPLKGDRIIGLFPGPRGAMLDLYMVTSAAISPSLYDAFFATSAGPRVLLRMPTTTAAQQEIAGEVIEMLMRPRERYESSEPVSWTFSVPSQIPDGHRPYAELREKAMFAFAALGILAIGIVFRILLIRYHASRFPDGHQRTRRQKVIAFFRPLRQLAADCENAWIVVRAQQRSQQDAIDTQERQRLHLLAQQERERRIAERRARGSLRSTTPPDVPEKPAVTEHEVSELQARLQAILDSLKEDDPQREFILRELEHAGEKATLPAKKKILRYALEKAVSAD